MIVDVLDNAPLLTGVVSSVSSPTLQDSGHSMFLVKGIPFHLSGLGGLVYTSYQKFVHDEYIDVRLLPDTPHNHIRDCVRCIGRGTIKVLVNDKELILENVLHCPALAGVYISLEALCRLDGCFIDERFGQETVVHFPFPVLSVLWLIGELQSSLR